jgi:hypothetical protein
MVEKIDLKEVSSFGDALRFLGIRREIVCQDWGRNARGLREPV